MLVIPARATRWKENRILVNFHFLKSTGLKSEQRGHKRLKCRILLVLHGSNLKCRADSSRPWATSSRVRRPIPPPTARLPPPPPYLLLRSPTSPTIPVVAFPTIPCCVSLLRPPTAPTIPAVQTTFRVALLLCSRLTHPPLSDIGPSSYKHKDEKDLRAGGTHIRECNGSLGREIYAFLEKQGVAAFPDSGAPPQYSEECRSWQTSEREGFLRFA